jgi:hypothetical protein
VAVPCLDTRPDTRGINLNLDGRGRDIRKVETDLTGEPVELTMHFRDHHVAGREMRNGMIGVDEPSCHEGPPSRPALLAEGWVFYASAV